MPRPEPLRTTSESLNFDTDCIICGGLIRVDNGKVQPHRCRIDLDAQRAAAATPQTPPTLADLERALPVRRPR